MGAKKDKLLKEFNEKPLQVNDEVYVSVKHFRTYGEDKKVLCKVIEVVGDKIKLMLDDSSYYGNEVVTIDKFEIIKKSAYNVGANPFPEKSWWGKLTTSQFGLDSILYRCGWDKRERKYQTKLGEVDVDELNFNPYVIDKNGKKIYYQRDFVWELKDKQLLIESIYNGINCGKIVLRDRGYNYIISELNKGNKEVAFRDVVDGKQRIGALLDFVNDKFPDLHGNYYSDLSNKAQHKFLNSDVISYASLGESATDEDVIETFLMVNFTGKIMSQEHIDYVKEISKQI